MTTEAQRLADEAKKLTDTRPCSKAALLCMFECEGCARVGEAHAIIDCLASLQSADQARDAARWQALEDQIRLILKGIDEDECLSEEGWWETSSGVEFGTERLRLVVEAIRSMATKEAR